MLVGAAVLGWQGGLGGTCAVLRLLRCHRSCRLVVAVHVSTGAASRFHEGVESYGRILYDHTVVSSHSEQRRELCHIMKLPQA